MKKTKERILEKALELFNLQGVSDTTLRQIAQGLEMSQGNLNYHFKLKTEIISALYYRLVERLNVEFGKMSQPDSLLSMLYQSSGLSMRIMYEYRFLLRDFFKIMGEQPDLHAHYSQLQVMRKSQFMVTVEGLIDQGIFRPPAFLDEYVRLYERMNIIGDNWINTQELLQPATDDPIAYYQSLLFEIIYPYLTDDGRGAYTVAVGQPN